jgi:biotin carboxylase
MGQFLFATESYPFTADIEALLADPRDRAVLITKDVDDTLSAGQRSCFARIVKVDRFDLPSIENAIATQVALEANARFVSHDDFFYEIFAQINERHRLPGYSRDAIAPFVNKDVMKRRLHGSGIRIPRYATFDAASYARDPEAFRRRLAGELGFPMFAKPIQGAGAEHCALLRTADELRRWCDERNDNVAFEIDEFIGDAVLYHCDSVLRGGRAVFTQASRYSRPCADFAHGSAVGSYTLTGEPELAEELCAFAGDVIAAFARRHPVPDGVTHMEMFRTQSGELVFLEVQFRPPGANVRVAYARHLGINLEDVHFKLQMGKDVAPVTQTGPYAAWMYFPTADGVVDAVHPLPRIRSEVVEANCYVRPGQRTLKPASILDARGRGVVALSLVIVNHDYEQLRADFERLAGFRPYSLRAYVR